MNYQNNILSAFVFFLCVFLSNSNCLNVMTLNMPFNMSLLYFGPDIDLSLKVADVDLHWSLEVEHFSECGGLWASFHKNHKACEKLWCLIPVILANLENPVCSRVWGKASFHFCFKMKPSGRLRNLSRIRGFVPTPRIKPSSPDSKSAALAVGPHLYF